MWQLQAQCGNFKPRHKKSTHHNGGHFLKDIESGYCRLELQDDVCPIRKTKVFVHVTLIT